jgi:hypothetical protein
VVDMTISSIAEADVTTPSCLVIPGDEEEE